MTKLIYLGVLLSLILCSCQTKEISTTKPCQPCRPPKAPKPISASYNPRWFVEQKNPHNIHFSIEKCADCMLCSLIKRQWGSNAHKIYCYHYNIANAPSNMEFEIVDRFNNPVGYSPFRIDNGKMIHQQKNYELAKCSIIRFGAGQGESFDYYLISKDRSTHIDLVPIN